MAFEASTARVATLDAAWMRERLDELCSFERASASDGERQAAEWLSGALTDEGVRDARVEEEPEANGTFWWPIGLLAGAGALAGLAARRGGAFGRSLGVATGAAAAALIADEMPPGRRRFRRMLPQNSCHHVIGELGPPDAERTIVLMAHHDAAHTAFFFNPAITQAVGESAPWVFEQNDTSPPLMWPVVGGPALVAAGSLLGSRGLTGLGTLVSAGTAAFMAHIGAGEVVPGANDNGTGCIAQLAIARALADRPPRNATDGIFPLAAGYQCVSIASCNQWKNPSNYHWRTDTPDQVDYCTVTEAVRLSEAVIRKLDDRWF